MSFNVRVEYECAPIRHIAVQCPRCEKWFYGSDITNDELSYEYQIDMAHFTCPVCENKFGRKHEWNAYTALNKPHIEEVSYPEVYDGCLKRKVVWE